MEIIIVKTFCDFGQNVFKKQAFWPFLSGFWPLSYDKNLPALVLDARNATRRNFFWLCQKLPWPPEHGADLLDLIKQTKNRTRLLLATSQCRLAFTIKAMDFQCSLRTGSTGAFGHKSRRRPMSSSLYKLDETRWTLCKSPRWHSQRPHNPRARSSCKNPTTHLAEKGFSALVIDWYQVKKVELSS